MLAHGRAKLARKGCDLLVVNEVGGGAAFGSRDNEAVVLGADGGPRPPCRAGPRRRWPHAVWDLVRCPGSRPGLHAETGSYPA